MLAHLRDDRLRRDRQLRGVLAAGASGSPDAVRAVGTPARHNPLPLVVPCHRVVRSDGSIGQYRGGAEAKQALLAMEAAA